MPRRELYQAKNSYETPEPHGKPGYTGYFPECGPKRGYQMGKTYERMTHDIMMSHPVAGLRFGFILNKNEGMQNKLEDEVMAWKHERTTQNVKFGRHLMVGYTGYVPRKRFLFGKSFTDECKAAAALMEKLKLLKD